MVGGLEKVDVLKMLLLLVVVYRDGGVELEFEGESIDMSSLIELALGRNEGGGGVLFMPSKFSQNSFPFELRMAWSLKLLNLSPFCVSPTIMSSSGISSRESCRPGPVGRRLGDEGVVVFVDTGTWWEGCKSESDSSTCRTTSASRRTSVSIGVLSSMSAARTRANPFVFG